MDRFERKKRLATRKTKTAKTKKYRQDEFLADEELADWYGRKKAPKNQEPSKTNR